MSKTRKRRKAARRHGREARKQRLTQAAVEPLSAVDNGISPPSWIYRLDGVSKEFYNSAGECVAKGCDTVSLTLSRGEFVAITGESGSGKSTLLSLLGFLATPNPTPQEGQFIFRGDGQQLDLAVALRRGIGSRSLSQWRANHIGFVFQNYHLMNHLSGRANVDLGLRFVSHERKVDRAEDVLTELGMKPFLHKRTRDLSGGQKQRISVARALVKRPDVLLADEPTGNLDTANKCSVLASLLIANARYGATVILVTHEIEHPPLIAHRSIVMRDGCISEDHRNTPAIRVEPDDTVQSLAKRIAHQGYPDVFADLKFD